MDRGSQTRAHTHEYAETDLAKNQQILTAVLERRQYLPFVKRGSDGDGGGGCGDCGGGDF